MRSLVLAGVIVAVAEAPAHAQLVGDGSELYLDAAGEDGPACITHPAIQKDETACAGLPPAPLPDESSDVQTLVVAQRKVGGGALLLTVTRMVHAGQDVVGPRFVEQEILPQLEDAPRQDAGASLVEISSYGVPHAQLVLTETEKDGTTVEAVRHVFFGKGAIYFITFISTPQLRASSRAWQAKALPTLRIAHPSRFDDMVGAPVHAVAYDRFKDPLVALGTGAALLVIGVAVAISIVRRRRRRP